MTLFQRSEDLSQHPQSNCSDYSFHYPFTACRRSPHTSHAIALLFLFISSLLTPLDRFVVGLRSLPRGGQIEGNPESVIGWG